MLKVSIATGSAHCWPLGGASNILQEINMKALPLLEENRHTKSGGELGNFSIAYFSLIGLAAVALELHMSQRNTAPNFQGKHPPPTPPPEDFGDSKAKLKALTFLGVILPESTVCGPFTDCSGFHSPSKTAFESRKLTFTFSSYARLWGAWCNWHMSSSSQFLNTEKYIASYALLGSKQPMLFIMHQGASTS